MSVDRSVIENLRDFQEEGQPDFLKELFQAFVALTPATIDRSEKALHEGDLKSLSRSMQQIRSQSGSLGARRLMTLCAEAEALSREQSAPLDLLNKIMEKIRKEYSEVERELRSILFS